MEMSATLRKSFVRALSVTTAGILAVAALLGVIVSFTGAALPEASEALRTDARVRVEVGRRLAFLPEPRAPGSTTMRPPGAPTGLVLYPGGFVHPEAYAPVARLIAEAGHPVVIIAVPLRLAFLDVEAAAVVPPIYPDVPRWAVGGHSLGGVAAAWFAQSQPSRVAGLVLWAAYTDDAHTLAGSSLPVLSVSGTRDGNVTPSRISASRLTLPPTTRFVAIDGGNHAQFGAYQFQLNDSTADITRTDQHRRVAEATVTFLDTLGAP
jgi:dienelactone hydrolase